MCIKERRWDMFISCYMHNYYSSSQIRRNLIFGVDHQTHTAYFAFCVPWYPIKTRLTYVVVWLSKWNRDYEVCWPVSVRLNVLIYSENCTCIQWIHYRTGRKLLLLLKEDALAWGQKWNFEFWLLASRYEFFM